MIHLLEQRLGVDHHARAQDAAGFGVEDPRRYQVKSKCAELINDGMAGVVTTLKADHHIGLLGQIIYDAPFALIAPLGTYYGCYSHTSPPVYLLV